MPFHCATECLHTRGMPRGESLPLPLAYRPFLLFVRACVCSLRLDKASGCLGAEGAGRLAAALRINNTLRILEVDGAQGAASRMGQEGALLLAEALMPRQRLQRLHINFSNLGDEGVAAVAEALLANEHLRDLALNSNKMGQGGARCLAELLHCNRTITALSISGNSEASPEGILHMAGALLHNSSLKRLVLSFIPLNSCPVTAALAKVLCCRQSALSELIAVDCRLDQDAVTPIALSLHACTSSLTKLDLSENPRIRDEGCAKIAEAMRHNACLKELLLNWVCSLAPDPAWRMCVE